jgi:hypothetical protein
MKWAGAIFAGMLYLLWPYYTLLELAQAVQNADATTINGLVNWTQLRANLKAQLAETIQASSKTASARDPQNAGFGQLGNALAVTLTGTLIDRMVTPEGLIRLVQRSGPPSQANNQNRRQGSIWRNVRFAFFVSPVRFRLDLRGTTPQATAVTLFLDFTGTGWQLSDVLLPRPGELGSHVASQNK